jgi:chromosome segregation ATPase
MEGNMSDNSEVSEPEAGERKVSFFSRVMRFLLRFLIVMLLGGVFGVAIYFGVPTLYRSAIEPMQVNTQRIAELEEALNQVQTTSSRQVEQAGERLVEIEGRLAEQGEALAAMEAELEVVQTSLDDQRDRVSQLRNLVDRVEDLTSDMDEMVTRVETLEATLTSVELPAASIGRQLQLIRAMTLLTKARLWLVQDNLGLAAEEITTARNLLDEVIGAEQDGEDEVLEQIVEKLDLALIDIRTTPIVAADELEIAWKLLVEATKPASLTITSDEILYEEDNDD